MEVARRMLKHCTGSPVVDEQDAAKINESLRDLYSSEAMSRYLHSLAAQQLHAMPNSMPAPQQLGLGDAHAAQVLNSHSVMHGIQGMPMQISGLPAIPAGGRSC
jgi:hypothetical protein